MYTSPANKSAKAAKFLNIAAKAESDNPRYIGFAVLASGTVVRVAPDGRVEDTED